MAAMISTARVLAAAVSAVFSLMEALAAKLSAAAAAAEPATELAAPRAWSSLAAWLKPPYLYVVVNGIIFIIAFSSRFHTRSYNDDHDHHVNRDHHVDRDFRGDDSDDFPEESTVAGFPKVIIKTVDDDQPDHHDWDDKYIDDDYDNDDHVMINAPERTESWEEKILMLSAEKPLVSPRLIGHRKPLEPITPDQGGLGALTVTRPIQHDSLENTWKAITEGRSTPLSRQMRKSDTWENHGRQIRRYDFDERPDPPSVKKSETFRDRTNQHLPAVPTASALRKEPSLSQDELNRRVEAFIEKFNEEMRLQRQESLNRYREMINGGTH